MKYSSVRGHALSPLMATLAMANVVALDHDAVERHKKLEAAKYPASWLWKMFDRRGISSTFMITILPTLIVAMSGIILTVSVLTFIAFYGIDSFYGQTFPNAAMVGQFAATTTKFGIWATVVSGIAWFILATADITVRPPARWEEYPIIDSSLPTFAAERMEAIQAIGLIRPQFIVAELVQGEDILDPVLYVEYEGERLAVAVWDGIGNEILL